MNVIHRGLARGLVLAIVGFAVALSGPLAKAAEGSSLQQAAPTLAQAATFAVLGGTTVTNTGATLVSGDLGVSPGTAITGFGPGTVMAGSIHAGDPLAGQAQAALGAAYDNLVAQTCTTDLTGQTLAARRSRPGSTPSVRRRR